MDSVPRINIFCRETTVVVVLDGFPAIVQVESHDLSLSQVVPVVATESAFECPIATDDDDLRFGTVTRACTAWFDPTEFAKLPVALAATVSNMHTVVWTEPGATNYVGVANVTFNHRDASLTLLPLLP